MSPLQRRVYLISCALTSLLVTTLLFVAPRTHGKAPANGTTVFRCIDVNGVISFADTPCKHSRSRRLRIEHSLIQSAPISTAEQQRLRALEQRLKTDRVNQRTKTSAERKRQHAAAQRGAERCKQATAGLTEVRQRKRRGYPVSQAQRIDREETALRGEIKAWCNR